MTPEPHSHSSRAGLGLVWSAVVACPCHWPLLVAGLLGGTAAGAALRANFVPVFAGAAIYFGFALGLGYWLIRRAGRRGAAECTDCRRLEKT